MKVLNLYAGIGGNRKLWTDVEVTAVENEQYIADVYKELYPADTVIVAELDRHLFWSNRHVGKSSGGRNFTYNISLATKEVLSASHGIELPAGTKNQRKLLRNAVDPALGLHVFNAVGLQKTNVTPGEQLALA